MTTTENNTNNQENEAVDYQKIARKNLEKVGRAQLLRAIEHVIIGMGPKNAYVAWLASLPEDAELSATGRLSNAAVNLIIADDELYNNAIKTFAQLMAPVLEGVAAG